MLIANIVKVGFVALPVGKVELPPMYRLSIECVLQFWSTTPFEDYALILVVPIWCPCVPGLPNNSLISDSILTFPRKF